MTCAQDVISQLAALLTDGEEVELEDLRGVLAEALEPMLADPPVGPASTLDWAYAQANAGFDHIWLYPSDAPRVAWEFAQAQVPTAVGCLMGNAAGRSLADAVCFEAALMMEVGMAGLSLVANTGAFLEGTLDEAIEPVSALLGTVHADEGDCSCEHHHHNHDDSYGEIDVPAVSVMLETGWMTPASLCRACDLLSSLGVDSVVAASGFGPRFASVEDVRLLCATVEPGVGVKAVTDATRIEDALDLLEAGASSLICTNAVAIMADFDRIASELEL